MCLAKEWVVLVVPLACTCAGLYCAKGYDETTSRLEPAAVRVQRRPGIVQAVATAAAFLLLLLTHR